MGLVGSVRFGFDLVGSGRCGSGWVGLINNQPCGQMYFRKRGDGVISKTMTMSKTTRTSHDKDKDKENN